MKTRADSKIRVAILVALIGFAAIGIAIALIGPLSPMYSESIPVGVHGGVTEIDLVPAPEGPTVSFKRVATGNGGVLPLGPIERFIPDPLPAPMFQWLCRRGGDMIITLGDGTKISYGPCYRPASINRLWTSLSPLGPPA